MQIIPDQMAQILSPFFITRKDFYSKEMGVPIAIAMVQGFPGLRGFWPGTANNVTTGGTTRLTDMSGNGEHFTNNSQPTMAGFGSGQGQPNVIFNGTNEWFSINDVANWDILGTETSITTAGRGLTMGAWVRFDATASASEYVLSKRQEANTEISYALQRNSSGYANFLVSSDGAGTGSVSIGSSPDAIAATTWTFVCGRFEPSTEMKLWVNDTTYSTTTSIPASIYSGAADLFMAGRDDSATPGQDLLDGRIGMAWICASMLDDYYIYRFYEVTRYIYQ